jgi:hypothetical protein
VWIGIGSYALAQRRRAPVKSGAPVH